MTVMKITKLPNKKNKPIMQQKEKEKAREEAERKGPILNKKLKGIISRKISNKREKWPDPGPNKSNKIIIKKCRKKIMKVINKNQMEKNAHFDLN